VNGGICREERRKEGRIGGEGNAEKGMKGGGQTSPIFERWLRPC